MKLWLDGDTLSLWCLNWKLHLQFSITKIEKGCLFQMVHDAYRSKISYISASLLYCDCSISYDFLLLHQYYFEGIQLSTSYHWVFSLIIHNGCFSLLSLAIIILVNILLWFFFPFGHYYSLLILDRSSCPDGMHIVDRWCYRTCKDYKETLDCKNKTLRQAVIFRM